MSAGLLSKLQCVFESKNLLDVNKNQWVTYTFLVLFLPGPKSSATYKRELRNKFAKLIGAGIRLLIIFKPSSQMENCLESCSKWERILQGTERLKQFHLFLESEVSQYVTQNYPQSLSLFRKTVFALLALHSLVLNLPVMKNKSSVLLLNWFPPFDDAGRLLALRLKAKKFYWVGIGISVCDGLVYPRSQYRRWAGRVKWRGSSLTISETAWRLTAWRFNGFTQ